MSQLATANTRLIRRYGRIVQIVRDSIHTQTDIQATSRKFKPEELLGSKQQNMSEYRMLDEDINTTLLCFPQKHDRIIDKGRSFTVENAQPIHLREQLVAWSLRVSGNAS